MPESHGIIECIAVRHEGGRSQDAVPVCVNDSGVHIVRKAEIVGVDDEALQLENVQLDYEELLWVRPKVLQ